MQKCFIILLSFRLLTTIHNLNTTTTHKLALQPMCMETPKQQLLNPQVYSTTKHFHRHDGIQMSNYTVLGLLKCPRYEVVNIIKLFSLPCARLHLVRAQ